MEEKDFITHSAKETEDLGTELAHNFQAGNIVVLTGPLGAGKTTFVQGVTKKFNVKSRVISPTFLLVRKHQGKENGKKINLYHIDLYRLEGENDIRNIGLEDIFEDNIGIFLIEWGEKHESLKSSWEINFKILDKDKRKITLKSNG